MGRLSAITRLLRTPQGRRASGAALDRAARLADRATGQKHADRIEKARVAAHRGLGRL